jgi:beta-lactamase regulating signal transducer with metallopeptidase domain
MIPSLHLLPTLEAAAGLALCLASIAFLTLVSATALRLLRAADVDLDQRFSWARYALLVTPALGPWLWFISSAAHTATAQAALELCASAGGFCQDALALTIAMSTLCALAIGRRLWRDVKHRASVHRLPENHSAYKDLSSIIAHEPTLAAWRDRIVLTDGDCGRLCTLGILRPRIECCVHLLSELSHTELRAALMHEAEHARALDPLLFLLLLTARALNPLATLLEVDFARWHATRELASDRLAHLRGADPLALAGAIIKVSKHRRPRTSSPMLAAHLGGDYNSALIEARVHALLAMASQQEHEECVTTTSSLWTLSTSGFLLALFALQPHLSSSLLCVELHHLLDILPLG